MSSTSGGSSSMSSSVDKTPAPDAGRPSSSSSSSSSNHRFTTTDQSRNGPPPPSPPFHNRAPSPLSSHYQSKNMPRPPAPSSSSASSFAHHIVSPPRPVTSKSYRATIHDPLSPLGGGLYHHHHHQSMNLSPRSDPDEPHPVMLQPRNSGGRHHGADWIMGLPHLQHQARSSRSGHVGVAAPLFRRHTGPLPSGRRPYLPYASGSRSVVSDSNLDIEHIDEVPTDDDDNDGDYGFDDDDDDDTGRQAFASPPRRTANAGGRPGTPPLAATSLYARRPSPLIQTVHSFDNNGADISPRHVPPRIVPLGITLPPMVGGAGHGSCIKANNAPAAEAAAAAAPPVAEDDDDDDVSSLGGDDGGDDENDDDDGLTRITQALRAGASDPPPQLTAQALALWDLVQCRLAGGRTHRNGSDVVVPDVTGRGGASSSSVADSGPGGTTPTEVSEAAASSSMVDNYYRTKYYEVTEQLVQVQQEQAQSLRAMQRVLADVTAQRDAAWEAPPASGAGQFKNVDDDNDVSNSTAFAADTPALPRHCHDKAAGCDDDAPAAAVTLELKEVTAVSTCSTATSTAGSLTPPPSTPILNDDDDGWLDDKTRLEKDLHAKQVKIPALERQLKALKVSSLDAPPASPELASTSAVAPGTPSSAPTTETLPAVVSPTTTVATREPPANTTLEHELAGGNNNDESTTLQCEQSEQQPNLDLEEYRRQLKSSQQDKNDLVAELDSTKKQLAKLKRHLNNKPAVMPAPVHSTAHSYVPGAFPDDEDFHGRVLSKLQRELTEKTVALENAKMIIASLEAASGSMASESREKLKQKHDEVELARAEAAQHLKRLDALAGNLRDAQKQFAAQKLATEDAQIADRNQRYELAARLEKSLIDVQAGVVVLESTQDLGSVDGITGAVTEAIDALKTCIHVIEDSADEWNVAWDVIMDSSSFGHGDGHRSTTTTPLTDDARELKRKLDEKSKMVNQLEDDLRKQKDEALQIRLENEANQRRRDDDMQALYTEIQTLREQCTTNMEVLTRKERELAVLRDSLKVDDDDVGYISDDASDDEEDEEDDIGGDDCDVDTDFATIGIGRVGSSLRPPSSPGGSQLSATAGPGLYGHSQAEALATLLAHTESNVSRNKKAEQQRTKEMEKLKRESTQAKAEHDRAMKQLKSERESLANAKMIISSLEKANKSMMEDLRSRLQDSNTAIASLLEKSMESEKCVNQLRGELEIVRREKEDLETRYYMMGTTSASAASPGGISSVSSYDEKKEEMAERID